MMSLLFLMLSILVLFSAANSYGATAAGTIIRSQAHATFLDEYGTRQQATSNEVETLIQEAPGVRLDPKKQTRIAVAGKPFAFPHVLTNTGNVTAHYKLSTEGSPLIVRFYRDDDNSGQVKEQQTINHDQLIELAAGESFYFITSGETPKNDTDIKVTARVKDSERCPVDSKEQGRCVDESIDALKVSDGVVYSLTKEMNKKTAQAGDLVVVTLDYQRLDNETDTSELLIADSLPLALNFLTGESIELCNVEGKECSELTLLDNNTNREGYSVSKVVIDGEEREQVTVQLIDHSFVSKGKIQFKVKVKAGFGGQTVFNEANFKSRSNHVSEWGVEQTSNRVPLTITGEGVTINGSQYNSAKDLGEPVAPEEGTVVKAGSTVTFIDYLWNTGTEVSDYTVSLVDRNSIPDPFPEGSHYCLTTADDCKPSEKKPGALTIDQLSPGLFQKIMVRVKLPESAAIDSSKKDYIFRLKAEVKGKPAVADEVINKLPFISDSTASVDLTYDQSLSENSNAPGKGKDAAPGDIFKTPVVKPDGSAVIDMVYINNTGGIADSYNLSFTGDNLPKGFTLRFYDSEKNVPLANTGVIAGKGSKDKEPYKKLKLLISVPVDTPSGEYLFSIEALSPVTGEKDTLPLSVKVEKSLSITLEPNGEGQVMPGSFITFAHRLTNTGNAGIQKIKLSLSDTLNGKGWQSILYEDKDGNAELSSGDPVIKGDNEITLGVGKTKFLIVKVFAPANAMQGAKNITTLKATWKDGDQDKEITVTDTVTVNNTNVVITKEQASWDCESAPPEKDEDFKTKSFSAKPGSCVVYKLTATNQGAETVNNVVIHDAAPNFTIFFNKKGLPKAGQGGKHNESGQAISSTWPELNPGASVSLYFGIQIQ